MLVHVIAAQPRPQIARMVYPSWHVHELVDVSINLSGDIKPVFVIKQKMSSFNVYLAVAIVIIIVRVLGECLAVNLLADFYYILN